MAHIRFFNYYGAELNDLALKNLSIGEAYAVGVRRISFYNKDHEELNYMPHTFKISTTDEDNMTAQIYAVLVKSLSKEDYWYKELVGHVVYTEIVSGIHTLLNPSNTKISYTFNPEDIHIVGAYAKI